MPMPVTTTLLLAAFALSHYVDQPVRIVVYALVALALVHECLRFVFTRPQRANTYEIPAQPAQPRERTPIEYDDGS